MKTLISCAYNDPIGYVDIILSGDPEAYLEAVTKYKPWDIGPRIARGKKSAGGHFVCKNIKYIIRDARAFLVYTGQQNVTKELMMSYKNSLLNDPDCPSCMQKHPRFGRRNTRLRSLFQKTRAEGEFVLLLDSVSVYNQNFPDNLWVSPLPALDFSCPLC